MISNGLTKRKEEKGAVMVVAVMVLAILTLVGIAATRNSTVELKIAGHDAAYRQAMYNADSGISFALRLNESDVGGLEPGDDIEIEATGMKFRLVYLREIDPGPPRVIEVRSEANPTVSDTNEKMVDSKGSSAIVAGVQLQVPVDGQLPGPGDEFEYSN
jgi:hypothetical protein